MDETIGSLPKTCDHPTFEAMAHVRRHNDGPNGEVTGFHMEIAVRCAVCYTFFEFIEPFKISNDRTAAWLNLRPPNLTPPALIEVPKLWTPPVI
jgi:hypothetical protein